MSVWQDVASLFDYTYRSDHISIMGRRREWFHRPEKPQLVLWWVKQGHRPSLQEAKKRLEYLQAHGPTQEAFTFKQVFPTPCEEPQTLPMHFDDLCPAT